MIKNQKKLLSLIKQNLREMAMKFDDTNYETGLPGSRPDPGIQNKLSQGNTPLKQSKLPLSGDEPTTNFQELLASERYKQVVQNIRKYTGVRTPLQPGIQGMYPLLMMMMQAHENIVRIEAAHKDELIQLAINLACKEMEVDPNVIRFDVEIVNPGEFDIDDFNRTNPNQPEQQPNQQQQQPNQEEPDQEEPEEAQNVEEHLYEDLVDLNMEKAKRRLINNIIQGSAKRGHYMYHLVEPELRRITGSETLINSYGILMSVNDAQYWQIGDADMEQLNPGGTGAVAGKESVDTQGGMGDEDDENGDEENNQPKPGLKVRAVNFPILIHEIIKGLMEIIAIHGRRPGDNGEVEDVETLISTQESEDTLDEEIWDLRLGPAIWDRLRSQFPEEILIDENQRHLQNYLLMAIFELPAKNFLVFMREIMGTTPRGRRMIEELMRGVREMLNDEPVEETIDEFHNELQNITDETPDDEIDALINNMNHRPETETETPIYGDFDNPTLDTDAQINAYLADRKERGR